ncbi:MAG: hypothetical protein ACK56W_00255 [Pirellula sp.]|jgi:hypothetical protein|nr:hypothetical protein [Pirellula sp.]
MTIQYLTVIRTTIVAGLLVITQLNCQAEDPASVRFIPRSDENAAKDLETLRYALSKVKDSKGNIDPLSDYVKPPKPVSDKERSKRIAWNEDDEAWVAPSLIGDQGKSYRAPRIELESVEDLYVPLDAKLKNLQTNSAGKTTPRTNFTDGFRPAGSIDERSRMTSQPTLASAPYTTNNGLERLSRFQDIPFGSQGNPTPPGLGNLPGAFPGGDFSTPNPNGFNPGGPVNPGTIAAPPSTFNPNPIPTGPPILPNNSITNPPAVTPGTISTPGTFNPPIANPNPTFTPGTTTVPGVTMPAPAPTYVPNPSTSIPYQPNPYGTVNTPTNPMRSPSDINPPRYNTTPSYVNSAPFVSGRPCETDARFMVSPTLFRPATDNCSTCGTTPNRPYASNPYTPGGTPFSYVPPTYFPNTFAGYNTSYRPLIGFGQDLSQAQLGRGIIGQPTAYMASQPVRNILRYIFP